MARKKILIPGGNWDELFLIEAAHKLGLEVITSGFKKDALGHAHAEKYIYADSSDMDAMLKIAQDEHIDYMCSSAFDLAYVSTAYVCEKLGLPGHDSLDTVLTIHQKDRFKRLARKIGLSSPIAEAFDGRDSAMKYLKEHFDAGSQKLIMKPIDGGGGRGISEVSSFEECSLAVDKAFDGSRAKRIVIEPYITGRLHSASVFLVDRRAVFCFVEEGFVNPENHYGVMCAISPAKDKSEIEQQLVAEFEKIAEALNLVDGKMHANFIVDASGKVWILEMHRRCSGDTYSRFVEYSTGIKWNEWIVKSECGMNVKDFPCGVEQKGYHMYYVAAPKSNGTYQETVINNSLRPMVRSSCFNYKKGDEVTNYKIRKLGVIHLDFPSYEEMREVAENLDRYFKVIVEEK